MSLNEILISIELGLIYGIVALGIYFTFKLIDFPDLTCDGSFALGAAISSVLIRYEINPWISLVASVFAGCIAGTLTAILYAYFKISELLAGILIGFMLYTINLRIMGGVPNIVLIDYKTIFNDNDQFMKIFLVTTITIAFAKYILSTDFGLAIRVLGQNKIIAKLNGVKLSSLTILVLALSNGIIALGGAIFSQHQGFADIGSGVGTVIIGFASIIIGEKLLPYRSISIKLVSCVLGSIIYRVLIAFALHLDFLGLQTYDLNLITGLMIIFMLNIKSFKNVKT